VSADLVAPPEERLLAEPSPARARGGRFTALILVCVLLHALLLALFIHFEPPLELAATEQEIPVEIIAEPPPQSQQQPQPEPAPPQKEQPARQATLDEKEAHDAPRAPNEDKVKDEGRDKATLAPMTGPELQKSETKPPEPPAPAEKAHEAKAEQDSAQNAKNDRTEGEPVKTAETPHPEAPEQTKAEKPAPQPDKPEPKPTPAPAAPAAAPDYRYASGYSPVGGGNASATYLSIVYGMVSQQMKLPKSVATRPHGTGEVAFDVDYAGGLMGVKVLKSSGLPELDAAAVAAIRAAAPFPLPPTGNSLSLRLRFSGT
jgi:TonB family protein